MMFDRSDKLNGLPGYPFAGVAEAGKSEVCAVRAETLEVSADGLGSTDREDHHPITLQVAAAAGGQRLEGDLIADPLDQDDRRRTLHFGQCVSGCLSRRIGPAHIPGEGIAGEAAPFRPAHRNGSAVDAAVRHAAMLSTPFAFVAVATGPR